MASKITPTLQAASQSPASAKACRHTTHSPRNLSSLNIPCNSAYLNACKPRTSLARPCPLGPTSSPPNLKIRSQPTSPEPQNLTSCHPAALKICAPHLKVPQLPPNLKITHTSRFFFTSFLTVKQPQPNRAADGKAFHPLGFLPRPKSRNGAPFWISLQGMSHQNRCRFSHLRIVVRATFFQNL